MSKSLEALQHYKAFNKITTTDYLIIKQDLERLEEINKVWHDNEPMESVDINGKHLQDLYDYNEELFNKNLELDKKVIELEKENKELAEAIQLSNEYIAGVERTKVDLINENKELKERLKDILDTNVELSFKNYKLKKAIEIIKDKLKIELLIDKEYWHNPMIHADYQYTTLYQQEYELLKEVLEND